MATFDKPAATVPFPAPEAAQPRRIDSAELMAGRNLLEINHGGQIYLLRVTRENKLILTK
ncbi:MAG TPA: hemin uptake protein HemP [Rhodocyclaceae bacterium]|nr:hemin uptake protein HemP [Rhodocyclaceae bacterium]